MLEQAEQATGADGQTVATAAAGQAAQVAQAAPAAEGSVDDATQEQAAEAVPVDYAKAITDVPLPDGVSISEALAQPAAELFARHNVSPDAVKEFVSFYAQQQKAGAEGNARAFAEQVSGWRASAERATTPQERGVAKQAALKVFGRDEVALLEHFGVTNRAGFIKALAKIGTMAIEDDTYIPGNAGSGGGHRDARAHFPNSKMNP
ncbi:hypothetical protein BH10PSE6_BH10PSE6_16740 [soil metagenome]